MLRPPLNPQYKVPPLKVGAYNWVKLKFQAFSVSWADAGEQIKTTAHKVTIDVISFFM